MANEKIELFAGDHAIEVEQFAITFRAPLDDGDEGRFTENLNRIETLFPSIEEPELFQFFVNGASPEGQSKPIFKTLMDFGRNGRPTWTAQFGENAVSVSCNKYEGWEKSWPQVKERLSLLLSCVDPFKFVGSIDYSVTDTLKERKHDGEISELLSKNILKKGAWVPDVFSEDYCDPRWDFSGGRFVVSNEESETLERVSAKGLISGGQVVVSITNLFSLRMKNPARLAEINDKENLHGKISDTFEKFHEDNKTTIRSIIDNSILRRMGL